MSKWRLRLACVGVIFATLSSCGLAIEIAYADTLASPNYKFDESVLGGGGLIQSNSANYQSTESLSDTAIGNASSTNFQIEAGHETTADPTLSFAVNAGSNFTTFGAATTATATSSFSVADYTSYGYAVQITGTPPTNGTHTISPMTTTAAPTTGIEQFGINLVANTSPINFGADPAHGYFAFGDAATNYNTPNNYRYGSGDTIASAPKSSGVTTYTISYIVNVSSITPGGQYNAPQTIICTGTY